MLGRGIWQEANISIKEEDGPSVLNNLDHKLTSKRETAEILSKFVFSDLTDGSLDRSLKSKYISECP